jgi:crotonobetainyl-CoA:carnitine CoA-transferase CaiB-like acyl-CoA transferase
VIEASRPRALAALGYSPEEFLRRRPGRTWVSITGYGRTGPRSNWVAFGDDAAVSGGLVAWCAAQPVFCADAIADPVSGVCAATAALASSANGGGHLIDCSMQAAAAFVNGGGACDGEHRVERRGAVWFASHHDVWRRVESPRPVATGRKVAE